MRYLSHWLRRIPWDLMVVTHRNAWVVDPLSSPSRLAAWGSGWPLVVLPCWVTMMANINRHILMAVRIRGQEWSSFSKKKKLLHLPSSANCFQQPNCQVLNNRWVCVYGNTQWSWFFYTRSCWWWNSPRRMSMPRRVAPSRSTATTLLEDGGTPFSFHCYAGRRMNRNCILAILCVWYNYNDNYCVDSSYLFLLVVPENHKDPNVSVYLVKQVNLHWCYYL